MKKALFSLFVVISLPWVVVRGAPAAVAPSEVKSRVLRHVAELDDEIEAWASRLWTFAEIALREQKSSDLLARELESRGFSLSRNVGGMPTAFVAEWGQGRPVLGVMAEFDALPNIGNDAVPRRQKRSDGHPHGHGCGHNLFGAGSVATAIALKETLQELNLSGTIRLYGAPAEETLVGKVYMANAGVFDDLDAALDWHPDSKSGVANQTGQAMNNFTVEFFGQAAHGAYDPWNGRSALDAVEIMDHAVNMMREHILPTARIHYVIPSAGEAPNVVPEYARVWYYVRDVDRDKVKRNYDWILDIAEGAAKATGTRHQVNLITGVHEMLLNRPLQEAAQKNFEMVGPPAFSSEEQDFARHLQAFLEIPQSGLATTLRPLVEGVEPVEGGSTDVAEVSWIAPTVSITVTSAGEGLPWHSWATSASHGVPGAARAAQVAARVLALTGVDLIAQPSLLAEARADFRAKRGEHPYESPIPIDQKPPLPEAP